MLPTSMYLPLLILVILILVLIGAFPTWPHGGFGYGWGPSGILGVVVLVLFVLILAGRL